MPGWLSNWFGSGDSGVGSSTGGMSGLMNASQGMDGGDFTNMSVGGDSNGFMDGLMSGANPGQGGKTSKYAAPTEGQDRALGMSAQNQYRDMSNYANMGSLMGPMGAMQAMGQNAMRFQERPMSQGFQNPYEMGLMGRR